MPAYNGSAPFNKSSTAFSKNPTQKNVWEKDQNNDM
jgi:hypothetical protein